MRIFSTRSSTHVLFDYYYIRKIVVKNGRWRGHHRRIREFHQRWQRFPSTLQMKPVPFYDGISDGRSSFGFSWSLLSSSLLSLSLSVSSPVRLYVALLLPWNLSFFHQHATPEDQGSAIPWPTRENDENRKLFVTSFRYIDTLFERIVGLRENSWHESIIVGRWGKLGWSVLLEDRSWASSSWISCRVVEKVFFPFFFYIP